MGACKNCSAKPLSARRNDVVLTSSMGFCCKVILNDEFLHHLFIPPRFAQKIAPLTNKKVQMKDVSGRSWNVELFYIRGALAFGSGWRSFTLDHGIKVHDQVGFSYISDSTFHCEIFGISSNKKWRFPSTCNNGASSSSANEDLSDGKGVKRKYFEDPCYIVNRECDFDQNADRLLDLYKYETYNSLHVCTNGSSNAQEADIEEPMNESSLLKDCLDSTVFGEDMRISCEGGEDFGSNLLENFPSTSSVSGTEHTVASAQTAPYQEIPAEPSVVAQSADLYPQTAAVQGPPVEVKVADLETQATACQGPPAEAKAADLEPQTTAFKDQTSNVTGLEAEGQTETADFNRQNTSFQGQTANFTGPAMESVTADFSGQTTAHGNQDAVKEPRESEPKIFGNERATIGGSVRMAKKELKGLNPQGFGNLEVLEEPKDSKPKTFSNETATIGGSVRIAKIEQKGLTPQGFDAVKELKTSMLETFGNETSTIGVGVRTAKIEQKNLNRQGFVGSAKIVKEEQNKFNPQGLGGSAGHVKIEQKNFRPNGFGGRMRTVKEEPNFHPNSFDGSAQRVNNEQFNLQFSRRTIAVGLVKQEPMEFEPRNVAAPNCYQALKRVKTEVQDLTQPQPAVTCAVTSDSNILMLPKQFSTLRTNMNVKVEFIRDSVGRLWPVMCCGEKGQQGLTAGWKSIRDANGIQIGDECVFSCEEDYQGIIKLNVVKK